MKLHRRFMSVLMTLTLMVGMLALMPTQIYAAVTDESGLALDEVVGRYDFQPITAGNDASAFENVTMNVKSNVISMDQTLNHMVNKAKLSDEIENKTSVEISQFEKIKNEAFVPASDVLALVGEVKTGDVLFDESNGIALRITDNNTQLSNGNDYVAVTRPQLAEVFTDFVIPAQTVVLNRANITNYAPGVAENIIHRDRIVADAGGIALSQAVAASDYTPQHVNNPLIELEFQDEPLVAYKSDGHKVEVKLTGYIGLDNIRVDGKYSFSGGYNFSLTQTEEIYLKAEATVDIKDELVVPLYGIDVPAGVAHVRGGVFLIIGINGELTVVTEMNQWMEATAGVSGGTFFGVPTSYHPFLDVEKDFDVDVDILGEINGYIKVGPMLQLELLGWDLAGAGAFVGGGLNCKSVNNNITGDVYGSLDAYISFFGHGFNLMDKKFYLYQFQQADMKGYSIQYYDVCAYTDVIWAKMLVDSGGIDHYVGPLQFKITRADGNSHTILNAYADSEGIVQLDCRTWDLKKGDAVTVYSVDGNSDMASEVVEPTFPFKDVRVIYADFFNDASIGVVSPVYKKNWHTGVKELIHYEGNIEYRIENRTLLDGTPNSVQTDEEGDFFLNYDFKPKHEVYASTSHDGFIVESPMIDPDTDFVGDRILLPLGFEVYDEDGKIIQKREEYEEFLAYNLRGSKAIHQTGTEVSDFFVYTPLSFTFDPFSGKSLLPADGIGRRSEDLFIQRVGEGTSKATSGYRMEWEWLELIQIPLEPREIIIPRPITLLPIIEEEEVNITDQLRVIDGWQKNLVHFEEESIEDYDSDPIVYRHAPGFYYGKAYPIDAFAGGISWLKRKAQLQVPYEGATIIIKDPDDTDPTGKGRFIANTVDPVTAILIDRVFSRINPNPVGKMEISHSINNLLIVPAWSRTSVVSMLDLGIMDLRSNGSFPTGTPMTRGEVASAITRAFSLDVNNAATPFDDMPQNYRYTNEITSAYMNGIVKGDGTGAFNPFSNVTREEVAVMVTRGLLLRDISNSKSVVLSQVYNDSAGISSWATEATATVYGLGLMKGDTQGRFNPKGQITFDEMAVLIERIMGM